MKLGQLLKDFVIYGFGDMLLRATAFITLPIYTRLFTPEDYGLWSFVVTTVGFLSGILALGGDSAYARFYFEAKTEHEQQLITSTWFSFLAVWSVVIVALCLPFTGLFSDWSFGNREQGVLFVLALVAAPVQLFNQMCGQILRNQFRASLFTTLNTLTTLLSIGLSLGVVLLFDWGIGGLLVGALGAALLMLPVRLWTARTMFRPFFSFALLRQLLGFGVPLVPTSLAYWVFVASDRLVLGKLSTLEQVGLYTVANNMTSIFNFLNNAIGQAWTPHAIRIYEEQRAEAPRFFGRVLTYILLGFGCLCVVVSTFAHEALVILSTPPFYAAAWAVGPLTLGFVALASTHITALPISLTKKTHYLSLYSWLAALLNLGLNLALVPRWGMIAASWTTAFAYLFLSLAYLFTSQRLMSIVYEWRHGLILVGLTLLFTLAAPWLPDFQLGVNLGIKLLYCLAYLLGLFLLQVVNPQEWRGLISSVQQWLLSRRRQIV